MSMGILGLLFGPQREARPVHRTNLLKRSLLSCGFAGTVSGHQVDRAARRDGSNPAAKAARSPPGKWCAVIPAALAAARSLSLSPIRKLAAWSSGQHRNKSWIIPGAGLRQSLAREYSGTTPSR